MRSAPHAALHPYAPVATEWDEPLAREILASAPASDGPLLVVQCRTGASVRALVQGLDGPRRVMAVDSDGDCIDAARSVVDGLASRVHLSVQSPRALSFGPGVFAGAIAVAGTTGAAAARDVVAALTRFVRPGGWIGIATPLAQTLPAWSEMLVEAAWVEGAEGAVEDGRAAFWSERDREATGTKLGVSWRTSGTFSLPIDVSSPEAYLEHPLVRETLGMVWRPMVGDLLDDASSRLATYYRGARVLDEAIASWHVGEVGDSVLDVGDADVVEAADE